MRRGKKGGGCNISKNDLDENPGQTSIEKPPSLKIVQEVYLEQVGHSF